jgi:hypothetical protein
LVEIARSRLQFFERLSDRFASDALEENRTVLMCRVEQQIEEAVCKIALDQPGFDQTRVSSELRKEGLFISPAVVRCVQMSHDLESFKKRLKALEAKVVADGILLTKAQLAALERKKEDE